MINIREYTRKKEKERSESLVQKIVKHRLKIFYRTVLVLVIAAAAAAAVVVAVKNHVYESYTITASAPRTAPLDSTCLSYNGNILTYNRDGASCTNIKGTVLWDQPFEMQNPLIDMAGDRVAFGDYNGSKIYVMNSQGPVGEIDTMMPIRDFCISENGVVAAVLDEGSVTWIYLFDSEGNQIAFFKTTMQKSGYPMRVSISPNGMLVQVSYLMLESGAMWTNIAFYNFGAVGQNKIDNLVSGFKYKDTIAPVIGFIGNENSFAVADNRLMLYEGGQIPQMGSETLLNEEIQGVYKNGDYIGLVYFDSTGEAAYKLDIYDKKGKLADTVKFDIQFTNIIFHKEKVIIYDETECMIYNIGGIESFHRQFDKGVLALLPTASINKYVLVTADSIDTIELK